MLLKISKKNHEDDIQRFANKIFLMTVTIVRAVK